MKSYTLIYLLILPFLGMSQDYKKTLIDGNRWDRTEIFGMVNPNYDPGTGDFVLAYPNFNYQGTELVTTDLSGMEYLNFDVWTAADPMATILQVSPVQMGPVEFLVTVPYTSGEWTTVSLAMSDFVGMSWTDVFQMKFAANGAGSTFPVDI